MSRIALPQNTAQSVFIAMLIIFKRFLNNLNATLYRLFLLLALNTIPIKNNPTGTSVWRLRTSLFYQ